eukprot:6101053-Prymnesium_polylepis.1
MRHAGERERRVPATSSSRAEPQYAIVVVGMWGPRSRHRAPPLGWRASGASSSVGWCFACIQ